MWLTGAVADAGVGKLASGGELHEPVNLEAEGFEGGGAGVRLLDDIAEANRLGAADILHRAAAVARWLFLAATSVVLAGKQLGDVRCALVLQ